MATSASLCTMGVAAAYHLGRAGSPVAPQAYWASLAALFLVAANFTSHLRPNSKLEGATLAIILSITTVTIALCYHPGGFSFTDEFFHYVTASDILRSQHLFTANPYLPVSPYYPGLELLTTSVASVSGLSIQSAAIPIIALVHLVGTVGIYLLAYEVTANARISAVATIAYASTPDFIFFDDYFAYQTLGCALVIAALLCLVKALKADRPRRRIQWLALYSLLGLATAITHHASAYILIVLSVAYTIPVAFRQNRGQEFRLPVSAAVAGVTTAIILWSVFIAKSTVGYLTTNIKTALSPHIQTPNVSGIAITGTKPFLALPAAHLRDPSTYRILIVIWTSILFAGICVGIASKVRTRPMRSEMAGTVWASVLALAALTITVAGIAGSQIGPRLISFGMVPGAIVWAIGVDAITRRARTLLPALLNPVLTPGIITILGITSVALAWPPYYAIVPTSYRVGTRIDAITSPSINAASWVEHHLGNGGAIATDEANFEALISIGDHKVYDGPLTAAIFISTRFTPYLIRQVRNAGIRYILVDKRIDSGVPPPGEPIFVDDPFAGLYRRPIPEASIHKFTHHPGLVAIYQNGPITLFKVTPDFYNS